jgi:hypothetical protein
VVILEHEAESFLGQGYLLLLSINLIVMEDKTDAEYLRECRSFSAAHAEYKAGIIDLLILLDQPLNIIDCALLENGYSTGEAEVFNHSSPLALLVLSREHIQVLRYDSVSS